MWQFFSARNSGTGECEAGGQAGHAMLVQELHIFPCHLHWMFSCQKTIGANNDRCEKRCLSMLLLCLQNSPGRSIRPKYIEIAPICHEIYLICIYLDICICDIYIYLYAVYLLFHLKVRLANTNMNCMIITLDLDICCKNVLQFFSILS